LLAPGAPGIGPTWANGTKEIVGCSLGSSRVWFTVGAGIINEVYYPRVDIPQIRDLGFIVANGAGYWVEVKRMNAYRLETAGAGIPAVRIVHECDRFALRLRIVPCANRDVLLVEVDLEGEEGLRPYALLAPHLGGTGHDNHAEAGRYHSRRVLWARQGPFALALTAADDKQRDAWGRLSAGFVGSSDGWQDFAKNGAMTWEYEAAGPGNVALLGELPRRAVLSLGFGTSEGAAATLAVSATLEPFEAHWTRQVRTWRAWHADRLALLPPAAALPADVTEQLAISAMVLRVHQDKIYPGSTVASLSVPWGNARDDRGGYHLVWPRDLVQCASALLATGSIEEPRNILQYLIATQHTDGHWNQNQWLGGKEFWKGIQLDEAAFPVLLAAALAQRGQLGGIEVADMIRRALGFVVRTGPASPQDRWEEDAGLNAYTLSICIAALVAGAEFLDDAARSFATSLADFWNSGIEDWIAAHDTAFGLRHGVRRYYVRAAPEQVLADPAAIALPISIRNHEDEHPVSAAEQVGVDFLQLVRFGLRTPDHEAVTGTLRLVDALLRKDTPSGPGWHRYTDDGYGEHDNGSGFDGTGRGRLWPLLTGERGHYELCRGNDALSYLRAMAASATSGGMIPEQVWDGPDIPELLLRCGKATGSATPLAWAHAEFIQLATSHGLGRPADRPSSVWRRYQGLIPRISRVYWCEHAPIAAIREGLGVGICTTDPGAIRWRAGDGSFCNIVPTRDTGLGLHVADIESGKLRAGQRLQFDYRGEQAESWTGIVREIRIIAG
jgi:glucoamylase